MIISRMLISVIVFGTASLIGFKAGSQINLLDRLIQITLDTASAPSVPIPNNDQFNLLIIGVTDTDKSEAQLESIWLVAFSEITQKLTFMPIFPSPTNAEQNQRLAMAFSLDQGNPSKTFWEALKATHLWWEGYILTDRNTTIEIVDMLNGIYVNETIMDGNQTVNNISTWRDNPQSAIDNQTVLLEGICHRLTQTSILKSKTTWELLINNPVTSNFQTVLQVANLVSMYRENDSLSCDFPTSGGEQVLLSNR